MTAYLQQPAWLYPQPGCPRPRRLDTARIGEEPAHGHVRQGEDVQAYLWRPWRPSRIRIDLRIRSGSNDLPTAGNSRFLSGWLWKADKRRLAAARPIQIIGRDLKAQADRGFYTPEYVLEGSDWPIGHDPNDGRSIDANGLPGLGGVGPRSVADPAGSATNAPSFGGLEIAPGAP